MTAIFEYAVIDAQSSIGKSFIDQNGRVSNEKSYTDEIARLIRKTGLCAINGRLGGHTSDDEVWIKRTNAMSEHYDIVTGDGYAWRKNTAICINAKF